MQKLPPSPTDAHTELRQVAESILTHSFAVYRLDDATAEASSLSWDAARQFFSRAAVSPEQHVSDYQKIVDGNLLGFNVVSDAKVLYRALCSDWARRHQPWPDANDGGELRRASTELAERLHDILVACLEEIRRCASRLRGDDGGKRAPQNRPAPPRKKRRFSTESRASRRSATSGQFPSEGAMVRPETEPFCIPKTSKSGKVCPLDYFLYHGVRPANNCSEHIDRGVLICVLLSDVPGLEVRPRGSASFVCPETMIHGDNLFRERRSCRGLVCVMAGDELKLVCDPSGRCDGDSQWSNERMYDACVHRVKTELTRARLSVTYELRGCQLC